MFVAVVSTPSMENVVVVIAEFNGTVVPVEPEPFMSITLYWHFVETLRFAVGELDPYTWLLKEDTQP